MNHYQEKTQLELERAEQYRKLYTITNPYPEEDSLSFRKELGLEAGALIASALGSITLSAIRTSTIFMLTEALLLESFNHADIIPESITNSFPLISMIVSLVAFEGMLAAHGFIKGKNSERIEISSISLWLCFGVTISAGLSASFGILGLSEGDTIFQLVSWILAVLTAIGAPVVAYYGSLNLGVITNKWLDIKNDAHEKFLDSVRSWNKSFQSSLSGKKAKNLYGENEQRTNDNILSNNSSQKVRSLRTKKGSGTKDKIISILNDIYENEHRTGGVTEIAKILSASENGNENSFEKYKGYVSKIRKEWVSEGE